MDLNPSLQRRLSHGLLLGMATGFVAAAHASVFITTDPGVAAAFMAGGTVEDFDDLPAFGITSYDPGQTISAAAKFSSRNSATQPTYHSGGASFNDPVGNPGWPVGIFDPDGGIAGDFVSSPNVVGPLVINEDQPFNNGFMEVIFPTQVMRVGFWVTSGAVSLSLRDDTGSDHTTGDFSANVSAGQFVGITRDAADVKVAALLANGTDHFTLDDFTYSSVPEIGSTGAVLGMAALGAATLLKRRSRRN
jgi:hypothetical protein